MTIAVAVLLAVLILIGAGLLYQQAGIRADQARWPATGRLIETEFGRLHIHEMGQGSPAVILESGIAASCLNWRTVQSRVAEFTRVASYDRAGLGWSDPAKRPRTPSLIIEELHALLQGVGTELPVILVGHSFGGLLVRQYASAYPAEVTGLVLVDALRAAEWCPVSDAQTALLKRGVMFSRRGGTLARTGFIRMCLALLQRGNRWFPQLASRVASGRASQVTERLAGEISKMPREVWPIIASHWSHPKSFEGMAMHFESLPATAAQMISVELPRDVPVVVLTAADKPPFDEPCGPNVKRIVAAASGHWIQLDEPELVVEAIRGIVDHLRDRSREVAL